MKTFFAAVFRKDKGGVMANPFQLNEAITREQALRGMTIWNAVARFAEHYSGSLEMGKDADFIITSVDLMTGSPGQMQENIVIATFIGGKEMYSKKK
jgi:predicted amidohydrolase YtcJ